MSEEYDILYDIDMELYTEFNDELCKINENLGNIYSYKEKEDVENAMKRKEIQLLRGAVKKLQKELEQEKEKNKNLEMELLEKDLHIDGLKEDRRLAAEEIQEQYYVSKDKIKAKIEELKQGRKIIVNDIDGVEKEIRYIPSNKIEVLEELLEE